MVLLKTKELSYLYLFFLTIYLKNETARIQQASAKLRKVFVKALHWCWEIQFLSCSLINFCHKFFFLIIFNSILEKAIYTIYHYYSVPTILQVVTHISFLKNVFLILENWSSALYWLPFPSPSLYRRKSWGRCNQSPKWCCPYH